MKKALLIPSSFTCEEKNPSIRTYKIGELARAAITFRINEIFIYLDEDPAIDSRNLAQKIIKILSYCTTAPWLRKHEWPQDEDLKEVGVIPPIKSPHHLSKRFRQGWIIKQKAGKSWIDCGLPKPIKVSQRAEGKVWVDTSKKKLLRKDEIDLYCGFKATYLKKKTS